MGTWTIIQVHSGECIVFEGDPVLFDTGSAAQEFVETLVRQGWHPRDLSVVEVESL